MEEMPHPRPPHLHRETTRHGKTVWYVRIDRGPRIRLRSDYGSAGFGAGYVAAVAGHTPPTRVNVPATSSLTWLIARYRESGEWDPGLSEATRRQRDNIFRHVQDSAGTKSYSSITKTTILDGIERRLRTPSQARHFLQSMRGLL